MSFRVFVVGCGMTKFEKPGKREWDYPEMGREAITKALNDAGVGYEVIDQAVVGYCYGDSTCGQRCLYEVGMTGIPVYNVNNNCSTGSSAVYLGKQLIEGGQAQCVLALGFEKMERGSLGSKWDDRTNPLDKHMMTMIEVVGDLGRAPPAPQMFGNAGREHMTKYGTTKEQIAMIAVKNHEHSTRNPYSQFRDRYSLDQVLQSRVVFEPLTMLQCCPTSEGAAAAILCNEEFVKKHNLQSQAIEIIGMAMGTDRNAAFDDKSCIQV
jgi:acetyl-CoA acetyltransferase